MTPPPAVRVFLPLDVAVASGSCEPPDVLLDAWATSYSTGPPTVDFFIPQPGCPAALLPRVGQSVACAPAGSAAPHHEPCVVALESSGDTLARSFESAAAPADLTLGGHRTLHHWATGGRRGVVSAPALAALPAGADWPPGAGGVAAAAFRGRRADGRPCQGEEAQEAPVAQASGEARGGGWSNPQTGKGRGHRGRGRQRGDGVHGGGEGGRRHAHHNEG